MRCNVHDRTERLLLTGGVEVSCPALRAVVASGCLTFALQQDAGAEFGHRESLALICVFVCVSSEEKQGPKVKTHHDNKSF